MMNIIEARLKKYLDSVIDVVFSYEAKEHLAKYKDFQVKVLLAENETVPGMYLIKDKTIVIYNTFAGKNSIAKRCLHELAHHIDYIKHGKTGHKKAFNNIYEQLIYATLDMKIFKKSDFKDIPEEDLQRVTTFLSEYKPKQTDYVRQEIRTIKVYNSYIIKDKMAELQYNWNEIEKIWEKDIEDENKEIESLKELGVISVLEKRDDYTGAYYEIAKSSLDIDAVCEIEIGGETYSKKDVLKQYGFYYKPKENTWAIKISSSEINSFLHRIKMNEKLKDVKYRIRI